MHREDIKRYEEREIDSGSSYPAHYALASPVIPASIPLLSIASLDIWHLPIFHGNAYDYRDDDGEEDLSGGKGVEGIGRGEERRGYRRDSDTSPSVSQPSTDGHTSDMNAPYAARQR